MWEGCNPGPPFPQDCPYLLIRSLGPGEGPATGLDPAEQQEGHCGFWAIEEMDLGSAHGVGKSEVVPCGLSWDFRPAP